MANRAVMLLSPVSKKLPDDARILNALGTASAVQGRFDDALGSWEKCLDIDPDRDQTLDTVAILLQNAGRNREARVSLERFLKLNPWRANAWGRHSRLLGLEGEWEAAIVSAKKAEELDPSVPQTYQFLSDAYRQTGNASQRRIYSERFEQIKRLRK